MAWSWSDIGKSIADVAPSIAGVLANVVLPGSGGAVSVVAKAGINALMAALGVSGDPDDPATADAVQSALTTANPDLLLRIKEADAKFQTDMANIGVKLEEIAAADRDSARKREIAVKDHTPAVVTYLLLCGFLVTIGGVTIAAVNGALNQMDPFAAGQLGAIISAVTSAVAFPLGYYFGLTNKPADTKAITLVTDRRTQ